MLEIFMRTRESYDVFVYVSVWLILTACQHIKFILCREVRELRPLYIYIYILV